MPTFSDDFTGSAGQKVLARSGWTKYGSGWDGDGPEINGSNQVRTSGGTDTALIGQNTGSADCFVQATVFAGFAWTGTGSRRLLCARSWDRNDMWGAAYNSGDGGYEIWKCEGGVYSRAGTWAGPEPAGDVLRLEVTGSTMILRVNGTARITLTGITYGAAFTKAGVFLPAAAAGVRDPVIDDYSSGDLGASDSTAPTFTGSITVGAKTSSTIALTLQTASDNVAVTGYQYRINGGAWVDNGNSTAVALSGLTALTSYAIDARAYDAATNYSATLSVTTSTYRAGASAGSIVTATAPQDGNPAGFLYALAQTLPTSDWVSYTITSGPTPSGGTLDAQTNGAFSYTGPAPATMVVQPEVNGTPTAETITVTLYDQVADLTASGGAMVLAMSSAAVQAVESLSASAMSIALSVNGFAVSDVPTLEVGALLFAVDLSTGAVSGINDAWPARGVRAIVSPGGLDHEPVKVFEQYSFDREVYEADFDAKYLAQVGDVADSLQAFILPDGLPGASRVAVGGVLSSGVVMFSIGPNAPVGVHEVLLQIATAGGRTKGCIVQIKVDR
jgi:hypothetical protein